MSYLITSRVSSPLAIVVTYERESNDLSGTFAIAEISMMTSSNGNIFRVIGLLWGEIHRGHRWIPSQRPVTRNLMFSLICAWTNRWVNNGDAGDLRRNHAHYDVTSHFQPHPWWPTVSRRERTSSSSVCKAMRFLSSTVTAWRASSPPRRSSSSWISISWETQQQRA